VIDNALMTTMMTTPLLVQNIDMHPVAGQSTELAIKFHSDAISTLDDHKGRYALYTLSDIESNYFNKPVLSIDLTERDMSAKIVLNVNIGYTSDRNLETIIHESTDFRINEGHEFENIKTGDFMKLKLIETISGQRVAQCVLQLPSETFTEAVHKACAFSRSMHTLTERLSTARSNVGVSDFSMTVWCTLEWVILHELEHETITITI
jgi:hypothetical protein